MERNALLQTLARKIEAIERARIQTGRRELSHDADGDWERLLVGSDARTGLVEWLEVSRDGGAAMLVHWLAAAWRREREVTVVIDPEREFYPPGAVTLGADLRKTVILRPQSAVETLWAFEQTLRTPGVGVVIGAWQRLASPTFRRLQLAAETGGTLGMLLRPAQARDEPSFAESRWLVQPLPSESRVRRWRIELLRGRKKRNYGAVDLELHDDHGRLRLVSSLAAAAPRRVSTLRGLD